MKSGPGEHEPIEDDRLFIINEAWRLTTRLLLFVFDIWKNYKIFKS
jgi:hypothetical protein